VQDVHIPKLVQDYISTGRRGLGRQRKRWTDQQPQRRNKSDSGLYNVPHNDGESTR